jgi:hypothetical protein
MFVLGKLFQPSLMFVCKATDLPQSEAPEKYITWVGYGLTYKHLNRL